MTMPASWLAKARRENRPVVDIMREHGEAGCPEFDPAHPFWNGCGWVDAVVCDPNDLRELNEAGEQLDRELAASEPARREALAVHGDWKLSTVKRPTPEAFEAWQREHSAEITNPGAFIVLDVDPPPTISTCPQCRALFPVGETCPGCGTDSRAAPGQPKPEE